MSTHAMTAPRAREGRAGYLGAPGTLCLLETGWDVSGSFGEVGPAFGPPNSGLSSVLWSRRMESWSQSP